MLKFSSDPISWTFWDREGSLKGPYYGKRVKLFLLLLLKNDAEMKSAIYRYFGVIVT